MSNLETLKPCNFASRSVLFVSDLLQLVEKRFVADLQLLRGPAPVPAGASQDLQDDFSLGFARGGARRICERNPPMASVSSPSATMARAASFSSRMFPGQLYSKKKFRVSGLRTGTGRQKSRAAADRNQSRRTGISSFRWRKGGIRKQTPLIP